MSDDGFHPVGSSLRYTAEQIALMAVVTAAQRAAAVKLLGRIGFAPKTRDKHRDDVWLLLLIAFLADHLSRLTQQMVAGDIEIAEWQLRSTELVRVGYVAATMLGASRVLSGRASFAGSVADAADAASTDLRRRIEAVASGEIRFALTRLERYARTLEADISVTTTEDAAVARSKMYGRYATALYELARREVEVESGMRFEKNVLGISEHCRECLALTNQGWVPIGTMRPPGKRICAANCKCRLAYIVRPPEQTP